MAIANKPIINLFWDRGASHEYGVPTDFADVAPPDKTQIFVLSPEVALAAEKLVRSDSFKLPDLKDVHVPYEHTAIEYELTPEIYEVRSSGINGVTPITHIGAHIWELPDKSKFMCTPYWRFNTGQMQHSAFSFTFGVQDLGQRTFLLNTKNSLGGAIDTGILASVALVKGMMKAGVTPQHLTEHLGGNEEGVMTHVRESAVELPLLVFACTLLINCKSGIAKAHVPERKFQNSAYGAKMRKKMSAAAFTVVHLSALEKVSADGTVASNVGMAAHYVRGHFKQRKSGVYWWSSFVRGSGEPRKRDAYLVKE